MLCLLQTYTDRSSRTQTSLFIIRVKTRRTVFWGYHGTEKAEDAQPGPYSMMSVLREKVTVKKEELYEVVGNDEYCINNLLDEEYEPRPVREILRDAHRFLGKELTYCVFRENCEHFVTELRYGKPHSRQVQKAVEIGVGVGLAAAATFGVLAAAAAIFGSEDKQKQ